MTLLPKGRPTFCAVDLATLEEGIELREAGIRSPIVILAGFYPAQLDQLLRHRLIPVAIEPDGLRRLETLARKRGVSLGFHLKVDTGMGRIGFLASEIDSWLPELNKVKALRLGGVFSHFSHAENVGGDYTGNQLKVFQKLVERLSGAGDNPPLVHL